MELFSVLAIIMVPAVLAGVWAVRMKMPAILGYVIAGAVVNYFWGEKINLVIENFGNIGIMLLLFLAGMELPLSEIKKMGKQTLILTMIQMTGSGLLGFLLALGLGFDMITAIFLGTAMMFGSTILVVKLFSEKGDLQSLPGKIAIGLLLVQDFAAVGMLAMISSFGGMDFNGLRLIWLGIEAILLVMAALIIGNYISGWMMKKIAVSPELVFLTAISWCLTVAYLVSLPEIGFSFEIGGFLAGLSLAGISQQPHIASRVKPLRDFFLLMFFVYLGTHIKIGISLTDLLRILVLSGWVIIVNPLIVNLILMRMGFHRRVAFLASLAVAQLSEFSMIVMSLGVKMEMINPTVLSTTVWVTMITMLISSWVITNSHIVYKRLSKWLGMLEGNKHLWNKTDLKPVKLLDKHIIIFGHHRVGSKIRPVLEKLGQVIVVDFNPEIVGELVKNGINAIYGDASDQELHEEISLSKAKAVFSTIPDFSESQVLLNGLKNKKSKPLMILTAQNQDEADKLYAMGADFVLSPYEIGGEYLVHKIESGELSL